MILRRSSQVLFVAILLSLALYSCDRPKVASVETSPTVHTEPPILHGIEKAKLFLSEERTGVALGGAEPVVPAAVVGAFDAVGFEEPSTQTKISVYRFKTIETRNKARAFLEQHISSLNHHVVSEVNYDLLYFAYLKKSESGDGEELPREHPIHRLAIAITASE